VVSFGNCFCFGTDVVWSITVLAKRSLIADAIRMKVELRGVEGAEEAPGHDCGEHNGYECGY
jgi:hypothetical protein